VTRATTKALFTSDHRETFDATVLHLPAVSTLLLRAQDVGSDNSNRNVLNAAMSAMHAYVLSFDTSDHNIIAEQTDRIKELVAEAKRKGNVSSTETDQVTSSSYNFSALRAARRLRLKHEDELNTQLNLSLLPFSDLLDFTLPLTFEAPRKLLEDIAQVEHVASVKKDAVTSLYAYISACQNYAREGPSVQEIEGNSLALHSFPTYTC